MADKKYTLGEVGAIAVLSPLFIALMMVIAFPLALWQAFVGAKLWNWFVAPYFHLQPLTMWLSLGFIYTLYLYRKTVSYKDHTVDYKTELMGCVTGPALSLLVGYLLHHFAF